MTGDTRYPTGETAPSLAAAVDAPRQTLQTPNAGRLCYYSDTRAEGRPLVLIHSVNAAPSTREMRPLFDHYAARRPVYAVDLPGFGCSERGDLPYSPALYAETINHFLTEVVAQPADVVAFSLSAEFAARAVLADGELFHSLGLISPTGFGARTPPSGPATDRILRVLRLPLLGDGLYRLLTTRLSIRHFLGLAFTGDAPAALVDYAYATSHRPGAKYAPFRFLSMKLFTPAAFDELYAALSLPVLVLYDRDPNISFERLDELAERPNWRLQRIAPTRGLPHWERGAETFAALDRFWATPADGAD
ncbi:MAG: alpha/beta hydrolase [Gammaproteobacteria bacterium]|nr:alpha/beta hydrolase [Gammaproteobacteria bacterium]